MMPRYDVITLFPTMFAALSEHGVSGRAVKTGLVRLKCWDLRAFASDNYRTVDDRPFGGGPGMVMLAEPLDLALTAVKTEVAREGSRDCPLLPRMVYLSPQGRVLDHQLVVELAREPALLLLAGRYEGIDERVFQRHPMEEISIGDFVLSGGELPAMVLLDALIRLIPGALGHADSAAEDSFADGLLDCPHYTRPEDYLGLKVPGALLSGNHGEIRRWRLKQSLRRTQARRPDLLVKRALRREEMELLDELRREDGPEGSGPI